MFTVYAKGFPPRLEKLREEFIKAARIEDNGRKVIVGPYTAVAGEVDCGPIGMEDGWNILDARSGKTSACLYSNVTQAIDYLASELAIAEAKPEDIIEAFKDMTPERIKRFQFNPYYTRD